MDIKRATARPTKNAAEGKFIGRVWQDEVLVGEATSRLRTTNVSLSPGGGGARPGVHIPLFRRSIVSPVSNAFSWRREKCRSSIPAIPR